MTATFNMKSLLTGASVLALAGVLAFANPAWAISDGESGFSSLPELEQVIDHDDEKEVNDHAEHENTSEMEQASSEAIESDDEIDAENEEDAVEEDHSNAAGGWWESVTQWFSG